MGTTGGKTLFFRRVLFVHAAARSGTRLFTLKVVKTLIQNSSRNDWRSNLTKNQPTTNPVRVEQDR